jgi:hypothetical protein
MAVKLYRRIEPYEWSEIQQRTGGVRPCGNCNPNAGDPDYPEAAADIPRDKCPYCNGTGWADREIPSPDRLIPYLTSLYVQRAEYQKRAQELESERKTIVDAFAEFLRYLLNADLECQEAGLGEQERTIWEGQVIERLKNAAAQTLGFSWELQMPDGYYIITPPESTDKAKRGR